MVIRRFPGKNPKVFFKDSGFELYINKNCIPGDSKRAIAEVFSSWFRKKAEEVITGRLKYYCGIIGVKYNKLSIKAQKTRWGSCSSKGNLNFNWRLVMAPVWVLDYVVIHELSHLKHMNHSKEFWDTVGTYMADYKKAIEWLKKNGSTLKLQFENEEEILI